MDQVQPEPTFEESIKQVMQTLPPPIRQYLGQGKYSIVAKSLMAKYGLRIDQGGVLEREIMLLLMGIENPDEFTQALVEEALLNQQTINSIVQDVNAQIFMPLRQEMMKSGAGNVPQPPPPKGIYAPPLQSPSYFHLDNKIPAPQAIHHAPLTPPRPQNPGLRDALSVIAPKALGGETPKLQLEDHEEPHIEFKSPEVRPSPVIPKIEPQMPKNLPGVLPPKSSVPVVPAKPYTSDPYREPIDEK